MSCAGRGAAGENPAALFLYSVDGECSCIGCSHFSVRALLIEKVRETQIIPLHCRSGRRGGIAIITDLNPTLPFGGRDYTFVVICCHMSPYVSVCPNLVTETITHLSKHISKALQNLCFQAESARVSPKKLKEKRYEKLNRGALLRQYRPAEQRIHHRLPPGSEICAEYLRVAGSLAAELFARQGIRHAPALQKQGRGTLILGMEICR